MTGIDLEQQHRGGGHRVPVFGCPVCIAMRDYWTCGCDDLRLNNIGSCSKCGHENPQRRRNREQRKREEVGR